MWTIAKKTKIRFLVFTRALYTSEEGFKAPLESLHGAGNPRIRVLVIEGCRSGQKKRQSGGGTCDGTECVWMGKDNEVTEMVPVIVHVWRYTISKKRKKKWVRNQHMCNVQDNLSVTKKIKMRFLIFA